VNCGFRLLAGALCLGAAGLLGAQEQAAPDQSEEDFFGSAPVEAGKGEAEVKNPAEALEQEHLGLSGNLEASGTYLLTRDFLRGKTGQDDNELPLMVQGDFLVDARLMKSYRAFLDLALGTVVGQPTPLILLKEVFVDFNFANKVYFRAGKQVLQWGVGYLWNPTDLINVQRKSFTDLTALREGVFGLRTDVVFSRAFHLYTFIDLNEVSDLTDLAVAARAEFLAGSVEFAFSGWGKYAQVPVFGFDLSAPLFWNLSLHGEGTLSWGFPGRKMRDDGSTYSVSDELVPRASVGLSRNFDSGNIQDRIVVNTEFYYNGLGYIQNMFEVLPELPTPPLPDLPPLTTFLDGDPTKDIGPYYHSGDYGTWYGALFVTINRLFKTNLTLNLSGLGNFSDLSFITLAELDYAPVNNFTLSLTVTSFLGPDKREYTTLPRFDSTKAAYDLSGSAFSVGLGAKVNF
jgi:hypothetical protein